MEKEKQTSVSSVTALVEKLRGPLTPACINSLLDNVEQYHTDIPSATDTLREINNSLIEYLTLQVAVEGCLKQYELLRFKSVNYHALEEQLQGLQGLFRTLHDLSLRLDATPEAILIDPLYTQYQALQTIRAKYETHILLRKLAEQQQKIAA